MKNYGRRIMDTKLLHIDLTYVEEIAGGDNEFINELIGIFICQIPDFIANLQKYLSDNNLADLAKEAHTAKSSALIFRMEETGKILKKIQLAAEKQETDEIPEFIETVKSDFDGAINELTAVLKRS